MDSTISAALQAMFNHAEGPHIDEVEDDLAGEKETLPDLTEDDDAPAAEGMKSLWSQSIDVASKGIKNQTENDYTRIIRNCAKYLIERGMIKSAEQLFCEFPPDNAPDFIIAYIMHECDELTIDGKFRPEDDTPGTFTHGQKLRSAMTHVFGRVYGIGSTPWHKDESTGRMRGNPSISPKISSYMLSLKTRKVQAGEVATSARAITTDVLRKLHYFNRRKENWDPESYALACAEAKKAKAEDPDYESHIWGGPMARREMQAIYLVAFFCLLRSDEVLKICREHLDFVEADESLGRAATVRLTLPFRKTHQDGVGIKPFVLYALPEEDSAICPVRALADWISHSGIAEGYIFRRLAAGDKPYPDNNKSLTSEQFLEMFRNNLLDIGINTSPYGTHSFRRGGCQYYAGEKRWPLRRICDWGGWSLEFSNLTIVKYLLSSNDEPTEAREDFLNPNKQTALKCYSCGRTCACA